ncbi:MAG: hypothetical protein AB7G93_07710 [Bdellovibrionales bacterium]
MTTTTYKYGKYTCKAYKKSAGKGWEVGILWGNSQIFVGNFIHAKEANAWWTMMNAEIRKFSKRYALPKTASATFFTKFMTNYIYRSYYTFLDRQFAKYTKGYTQTCRRMERTFTGLKKRWPANATRTTFRKAA